MNRKLHWIWSVHKMGRSIREKKKFANCHKWEINIVHGFHKILLHRHRACVSMLHNMKLKLFTVIRFAKIQGWNFDSHSNKVKLFFCQTFQMLSCRYSKCYDILIKWMPLQFTENRFGLTGIWIDQREQALFFSSSLCQPVNKFKTSN